MSLSLKNLELANKVYTEIQKLDSEIIALDKLVQKESEHGINLTLKLEGEFPSKDKKEKVLDEDGSLFSVDESRLSPYSMLGIMGFATHRAMEKSKVSKVLLEETITESVIYGVIGVIYNEKLTRREACIDKLKSLGVNI